MNIGSLAITQINDFQFGVETPSGQKLDLPSAVEVTNHVISPSGNIEVLVLKNRLANVCAWNYFGLVSVLSDGRLSFHLPDIEASLLFGRNTFVWDVVSVDDAAMLLIEVAYGSQSKDGDVINYRYEKEKVWLLSNAATVSKVPVNNKESGVES